MVGDRQRISHAAGSRLEHHLAAGRLFSGPTGVGGGYCERIGGAAAS